MTKEQLRAYQSIKRERDKLQRIIDDIDSQLYGPRSQRSDGMPRGNGPRHERADVLIDRKDKILKLYAAKVAELEETLLAIEQAIGTLTDPTHRTLIRLRYIEGLKWEQVCVELGYEWSQTHRHHADALRELRKGDINA